MHVEHLSITLVAIHSRGDDDQSFPRDEVAYTSTFTGRFGAWVGLYVEFERAHQTGQGQESQPDP